jgi:hypothetical protein
MYQVLSRKVVAYTRLKLPITQRRRLLRRASRAANSAGASTIAGICADAIVHQHGLSLSEVDLDVKVSLVASALTFAATLYL